jgi:hypothetical protein
MIVPSDEDYKQTKLIKEGTGTLPPPLHALTDWISEQFAGATPLNIYYDKIPPHDRPRLSVIFEWERDARKFRDHGGYGNFYPAQQAKIAEKFREIIAKQQYNTFDASGLLVIFSAFEPVARIEANWRVTKEQIAVLKKALECPAIWEIRPGFEDVVFFFYTEAQLRESERSNIRDRCKDGYSRILKEYDEFAYFRERPITVSFDSKENFDSKYKSNWFYYDKR